MVQKTRLKVVHTQKYIGHHRGQSYTSSMFQATLFTSIKIFRGNHSFFRTEVVLFLQSLSCSIPATPVMQSTAGSNLQK